MEPVIRNNVDRSRYELMIGEGTAGFVEYRDNDGQVELLHTEVESAYEGQGVGSQLARAVLDDVRERGLVVAPYCPFLRSYLRRHPEYADLIPADRHAEFGLSSARS